MNTKKMFIIKLVFVGIILGLLFLPIFKFDGPKTIYLKGYDILFNLENNYLLEGSKPIVFLWIMVVLLLMYLGLSIFNYIKKNNFIDTISLTIIALMFFSFTICIYTYVIDISDSLIYYLYLIKFSFSSIALLIIIPVYFFGNLIYHFIVNVLPRIKNN